MKHIATLALLFASIGFAQTPVKLNLPPGIFPPAQTPIMHVEVVPITATTTSYSLLAPPIAAMGAVFYFSSSFVGYDVFLAVPSVQPTLSIILPTYPGGVGFSAQDTLTVVYYSNK